MHSNWANRKEFFSSSSPFASWLSSFVVAEDFEKKAKRKEKKGFEETTLPKRFIDAKKIIITTQPAT